MTMNVRILKRINTLINQVKSVPSQLSVRDLLNLKNASSIVLVLCMVNAREAITITEMTVTWRTVTCRIAQRPAEDLGQVLEVTLEKTMKLMFALVLYVLQMYVLRIETNLI